MSARPSSAANVIVIGSINMDLVLRCERMPRPGETLAGHDMFTAPGGKGANQAVAAARLGARCRMVGRVGDDGFADELLAGLERAGVVTDAVHPTADCSSGIAVIHVDAAGENAITLVAGANGQLSPDDITQAQSLIAQADVMLLQLEVPLPTVCAAMRLARRHGVMSILDPAPAPATGLPDELFAVDLITPNQTEAQLLTGEPVHGVAEAKLVAAELIRRGAGRAVIKLGEHGAVALDAHGEVMHTPAFAVDVVDTTAAGDAFTAALGVGLAEKMALADAVRLACAAGGLAAGQLGAQQAMPTREQVDRLGRRA